MTSKTSTIAQEALKFPVFPPRDDMQNWLYLYAPTIMSTLSIHYADQPNTVVGSEIPVGPDRSNRDDVRIPDMAVIFNSDQDLIEEDRGYDLGRHGKPPDLVLEVASPTTASKDYTDKRRDYERYGIREYWRLDPTGGDLYGVALAGDRLVDGQYRPVSIERMADGSLRGYSEVLGLYLCWGDGRLRFLNPETGSYLLSHQEEAARADEERARAEAEAEARRAAETEVRRLREQLRGLDEGQ